MENAIENSFIFNVDEMETYLRVCPCVLLSELNDRGITASCEIDMCSAITMRALSLATEGPAACLDWNNNYGDDPDKVILFHCGSTAQSLMKNTGTVTSHKMFDKGDPGSGWGTNEGRIAAFPMTYSNCKTEDGKITIYFSEGEFTGEDIEKEFGPDVAKLVDGVTKLGKIQYSSQNRQLQKEEIQAENYRKMFLAMAQDIRVVIIKLADRLVSLRKENKLSQEALAEKIFVTRQAVSRWETKLQCLI